MSFTSEIFHFVSVRSIIEAFGVKSYPLKYKHISRIDLYFISEFVVVA